MSGSTKVPDIGPQERERRYACLAQAGRIRGYLPTLRAREEALVRELAEVQDLIRDELKAYDELMAEANSTPEKEAAA